MTVSLASFELNAQQRRALDLSVFYAGALSLMVAITGTVAMQFDTGTAGQADAQDVIETVADQTVL